MKNVTLKQFRYFEALAQHHHFGRAADACAISQPALSMQIKELEEMVGTPLFERASRDIRLTAFGEDFAGHVRNILQAVEDLGELAQNAKGRLAGRLRLGVIPTIAPYLLPKLIANLSREYPGLDIHVRETLTSRLIEELGNGRLDAAILALPISNPTFEEAPLFSEEFVLVRPNNEQNLPVPSPEMLSEMRLFLLEEGHCFRDQALALCNMRSATPREGFDGSSLSTLVQMVGAGMGVTLIPEMAVNVETRSADVSVARFNNAVPARTVGMIWRRTSPLSQQLSRVAEIVRMAGQS